MNRHLLPTPMCRSEACNLLLLQEYIRDVSHAQQILEQTAASLQRTEILTGILSGQDLRTLRTAVLELVFVSELKSEQTQWNVQSLSNCSLCNQEYSHVPPKISTRLTQAALPELLSTISTDVVVPTGKLIAGKPTTMPSCPQSSLTRSHWIQYCKQFTPINSLSPPATQLPMHQPTRTRVPV